MLESKEIIIVEVSLNSQQNERMRSGVFSKSTEITSTGTNISFRTSSALVLHLHSVLVSTSISQTSFRARPCNSGPCLCTSPRIRK
jgi:hypothetical protein